MSAHEALTSRSRMMPRRAALSTFTLYFGSTIFASCSVVILVYVVTI
jgi:hypothetical protein